MSSSNNTRGLLRCIEDLYVPTRTPIGKASPPRFTFEPISRRQRLLLDELDTRARQVVAEMASAEEEHTKSFPGELPPAGSARQAVILAALAERADDGAFTRWWSELQTLRRPFDARAEMIAAERAAVAVAGLGGDWSLVVASWTQTPTWPALVRTGYGQIGERLDMLDEMPSEVVKLLQAWVRDGLAAGAARLDETERGN